MQFTRVLSLSDRPVEEQVQWKTVPVELKDKAGQVIFSMPSVEAPAAWSSTAVQILATKYFRKAGVPQETLRFKEDGVPQFLWRSKASSAELGGETSAKQVFHRLAGAWTYHAWKMGLFHSRVDRDTQGDGWADEKSARIFYDELFLILAKQLAAPNSPQWFNSGLWWAYGIEGPPNGQWTIDYAKQARGESNPAELVYQTENSYKFPQPHACFIQPISDDLVNEGGIMDLWTREARLFKYGSGTGSNFSNLRGENEPLSGGGKSSGLMSFLEIGDRAAGAIKSGGTTRRAAKMVIVDADHPDVEKFIDWKMREEAKAASMYVGSVALKQYANEMRAAKEGGYYNVIFGQKLGIHDSIPQSIMDRLNIGLDPEVFGIDYEGEAIRTVSGQNANNTVRVQDAFMQLVEVDGKWFLKNRTDGEVVKEVSARDLWTRILRAAWASADPGLQFHDTINSWHTCKQDGEIRASNPCCFVGETLVDTSEGLISIGRLQEMDEQGQQLPYAFSFDRNSAMPALRKIRKAWIAGYAKSLVRVRLDTGEEFTCTPEHRWLLRNGQYCDAELLRKGMSLRKIGRNINDARGSRCSILHRCTDEVPNGTQYQSRWMWEQVNGPIPKGFDIHYRDDDPTNDRLSNFELIEATDHKINHSAGSNNPRYMIVDDKALVEIYDAILAIPRKTHKLKSGVTPGRWNAYVRENGLVGIVPQAQSPSKGGKIQGLYWSDFVSKMENLRREVNARVVEVIRLKPSVPVPVFDIEVEGTHNFAIRGNKERNQPAIVVSNSEYMFLDNTACNLASLNLAKFYELSNLADINSYRFKVDLFSHVAQLMTIVLDISVTMASFPSKEIAEGSYNYRTLGLGYANLGGLLMRMALPYDSVEGRAVAAAITAIMHGVAYSTSSMLASELGPFPRWEANKDSMKDVLLKHKEAVKNINCVGKAGLFVVKALSIWDNVTPESPFRNAQVTLLAPTGTIGLLMDCDTLGIEPDFSLVKYKSLAGGGENVLINEAVDQALVRLGYKTHTRNLIRAYIRENGTVENCDFLQPDHLPVFDCAVAPPGYSRCIATMAHVLMCAAVQPFLSGAISKTINMPNSATIEDVGEVYMQAWKLGLKAVALYRDGSKLAQPLETSKKGNSDASRKKIQIQEEILHEEETSEANKNADEDELNSSSPALSRGVREYLPWRRDSAYVQKVKIGDQSLHLTVGRYPDGRPGEVFLELSRVGTTLHSFGNLVAMMISIGLQYGVPVEEYVKRLSERKFEPSGFVEGHENIKWVASIADFIARELGITFLGKTEMGQFLPGRDLKLNVTKPVEMEEDLLFPETKEGDKTSLTLTFPNVTFKRVSRDICPECGEHALTSSGTCKTCESCGFNDGCGG